MEVTLIKDQKLAVGIGWASPKLCTHVVETSPVIHWLGECLSYMGEGLASWVP